MKKSIPILMITGLILCAGAVQPRAASAGKELEGIQVMQGFVGFLDQWMKTVEDPSNSIGLAVHSLKDLYVENGEPERAVQILNQILTIVEDPAGRNAIRFTLAELHKQLNQPKQASDQLLRVIEENAKGRGGFKAAAPSGAVKSVFE
ncbi:MAG: tetratricopeptide repeat protein [Candidatus Omnitrophica bacterium]|nr:tetratricopeptide repeat protein [Candidatus Omnitrophota bacterium]